MLAIVIPTYNEADNITKIIPEIMQQPIDMPFTIIVIDDNSPDGTGKLVEEMARTDERIQVIHRPAKMGLGTAYITAFKHALANPDVKYIIEMDADFSHNPQRIPEMLDKIQHCDIVVGSRYINGISVVNWPLRRLILSYSANFYARWVTGVPLQDVTSGFKCFRRHVLETIDLDSIHSNGYAFQVEMNFRASRLGFRFIEIPIIFVDRHAGTSKLERNIVWEALLICWRLRLGLYKRGKNN